MGIPSATDGSVNDLVERHLYLVQHVVNQLAARYPQHVDRQELWNAGALGLVDASRRYDPAAGTPFGRYAAIRIRGAIIDSTRGRDFSTRSLRRQGRAIRQATDVFAAEQGRLPEEHELAAQLGLTEHALASLRTGLRRTSVLRLDQPAAVDGEESVTLADLLEEPDSHHLPEPALERRELVGTLLAAIDRLPTPLDTVVRRYYLEGDLLADIALDLGVTEARVSQIRQEGLIALRAYFHREFTDLAEPVPEDTAGRRHRTSFLLALDQTSWRERVDAAAPWAGRLEPAAMAS